MEPDSNEQEGGLEISALGLGIGVQLNIISCQPHEAQGEWASSIY